MRKITKKVPVTLIDCDGIMANFVEMYQNVVREQFGINPPLQEDGEWDIFNFKEVKHIKDDVWNYILKTPGLIRDLNKFPYADDMIQKLREVSQEVICVTSVVAGGFYADERINWLIEEMGFSRFDIILAYKKHLVLGDVFIDDKPENVIHWADAWWVNEGIPVLWQPPGRGCQVNDDRIYHTGDIDQLIDHLVSEGKIRGMI